MQSSSVANSAGTIASHTYGYGAAGNITSIDDQDFGYDTLGRLTSATGGLSNISYEYDAIGNRTAETKNGTPRAYTYENGLLMQAGGTAYTYHPDGSLATKTEGADSWVYNWDGLGRLSSVQKNGASIGTYGYDADGLRVWKEENGQTTLYIRQGGQVLYQETFSGTVDANAIPITTKGFVILGGQTVGTVVNGTEAHYFLNDHLGTTEIVTDGEGRVTEDIRHTPFSDLTHVTATAYQRMAASNPDWIDTAATTAQVVDGRIVPAKAPQEVSELLHQDNQPVSTEDPHYVTAKEFTFEHDDPDVVELKVLSSFKYAGSSGQYVEYEDRIDLTGKPLGTYKVRLETRKDVGGGEPTENLRFEVYVSKVLAPVESIVQTMPIAIASGSKAFCLTAKGAGLEDVAWAYSIDGGQGWIETALGTRIALAPEIGSILVRATLSPQEGQGIPEIEGFDVGVESERADSGHYLFTGKERDANGLYYFHARYYDPEIGRFVSEDPARYGVNWYGYCSNRPLCLVDHDGTFESLWWLRSLVPGQVAWDNALTAFEEGQILTGIGYTLGMVGEQLLFVFTLGQGTLATKMAGTVSKKGIVLWSGSKDAMYLAAEFAKKNGMRTLEQTTRGKILSTMQSIASKTIGKQKAYNLLRPLWDKASASFVQGADGTVHVFLNAAGISDMSTFMRIEWDLLKKKGLDVVFHLVKRG